MKKPPKPISNLPQKAKQAIHYTYALYAALLSLVVYIQLERDEFSWAVLCIKALPILALLPGLLTNHYRSYSWLCFLTIVYFVDASMMVSNPSADFIAYTYMFVAAATFVAAMYCSRFQQRMQKKLNTQPATDSNDV